MSFNANASICWDENPFSVYFYTTNRLHLPQSILHLAMPRAIAKSINSSSRLDFRIPLWFKVRGIISSLSIFRASQRASRWTEHYNRLRILIHIPIYKNQVRRLVARLLRCNFVHPFKEYVVPKTFQKDAFVTSSSILRPQSLSFGC